MSKKDTFVPSITLEQVQKIKSRIAEAIKEYGKTVIDKEAYAKATEGLKYKSSNGQKVYLVVPTRSQKKKIQNEYLRGIQIEFNKNHKLHYQLKFAGFNKSKLWIPALLGGLATTGGATGAAVYFALQEGGGTFTENYTITLNLAGGSIAGHTGDSFEVAPGTTLGELPKPTRGVNEEFDAWTESTTNVALEPGDPVEDGHTYIATYKDIPQVVTLSGGTVYLRDEVNTGGGSDAGHPWILKNGQTPVTGAEYSVAVVPTLPEDTITIPDGVITWASTIPEGSYDVTITAKDPNKTSITANAEMHLDIYTVTPPPVEDIVITGDGAILDTVTKSYSATGSSGEYKWSVAGKSGQWDGQLPAVSTGTTAAASTNVTAQKGGHGTCILTATDPATNASSWIEIEVSLPYENSSDIWLLDDNGSTVRQWIKFDSSIYDPTKINIAGTILHSSLPWNKERASFGGEGDNFTVYIGDEVVSIEDNFLSECSAFNKPVIFPTNTKCNWIGDNFLAGDINPTAPIVMSFNNAITLPNTVRHIGDNFLLQCQSFNPSASTALSIPTSLEWIGENFLYNAKAFNKNITINSTVKHIGNTFMFGCENMSVGTSAGTITVNAPYQIFESSSGTPLSFAFDNATAPAFLGDGIAILAEQWSDQDVTEFQTKFPDWSGELGFWRKLNISRS